MIGIEEYNEKIRSSYSYKHNSYSRFLNKYFPMWEIFERKVINDDVIFYKENVKVFSIRIDIKHQKYMHIDFYKEHSKRPYKRAFILNECITLIRYYEFNTWNRNYDVIIGKNYEPRYTIEYFENGRRWIDWHYQSGKVFYDKEAFLEYILKSFFNNLKSI